MKYKNIILCALVVLGPVVSAIATYKWVNRDIISLSEPIVLKFKPVDSDEAPKEVFILRPDGFLLVNVAELGRASQNLETAPSPSE